MLFFFVIPEDNKPVEDTTSLVQGLALQKEEDSPSDASVVQSGPAVPDAPSVRQE